MIPAKGYYSYNLGSWHIIALNTAPCADNAGFCAPGSAQEQWLKNDLAANASKQYTLAYYQNPRFVSTNSGGSTTYQPFWDDLYAAGAEVVLNGDSHWYERLQQMNSQGALDTAYGIREFIVGTGGAGLDTPGRQLAASQVINNVTHGVIKLTLRNGSFDWSFVPVSGETFTDSGSGSCHGAPAPPPPPALSYKSTVLGETGLTSYWRLGEASGTTATDSKGTNNGTYSGVSLGAGGAITNDPNTAASFNGSTSKVTLPSLGTVGDFTIEGWTYLTNGSTTNNDLYGSLGAVRLLARPGLGSSPTAAYAGVWLNGTEYLLQPNSTASNLNTWVYWTSPGRGTRSLSTATVSRSGSAPTCPRPRPRP